MIKEFSKLEPSKTTLRVGLDWLTIFLVIYYAELAENIIVSMLAILIIGSRMHALGVIAHDLVHYRYLNNRKLSDLLGNLFICWPLFFSLEGYRAQHLRHHSKLNTNEDPDLVRRKNHPDWTFPMRGTQLLLMILKDLLGFNLYQYIVKIFVVKKNAKKLKIEKLPKSYYVKMGFFYFLLAILLYSFSVESLFLIYWLIPIATSLKLIKRIRAIAEHFAIPKGDYLEITRTTIPQGVENYFIGAHDVGYHLEHHRYPSIPFYNLKEFHDYAKEHEDTRSWGHYSNGYLNGVFREALKECALNSQSNLRPLHL